MEYFETSTGLLKISDDISAIDGIFSRPVDVSKYSIIYGGAQKNLAPAGVTFVIIKEDVLGKVTRAIPSMLDYRVHLKGESMFNTPPVFAIFAAQADPHLAEKSWWCESHTKEEY